MNLFDDKYLSLKDLTKPFLKWAGGKTQLLEQFETYFPDELKEGQLKITMNHS